MRRVSILSVLVVSFAGLLFAALPERSEQSVVKPSSQCDTTVHKLGGVQLPYLADGILEYDAEAGEWLMGFAAPLGWDCTHLSWSFPADNVPPELAVDPNGWSARGTLDVMLLEDMLCVSVWTEDAIYDFEFAYSDSLVDEAMDFVQIDNRLVCLRNGGGQGLLGEENCPGGNCECEGKCKACCSEGFHPRCNCKGAGACNCCRNVSVPVDGVAAEPVQVVHYNVDRL